MAWSEQKGRLQASSQTDVQQRRQGQSKQRAKKRLVDDTHLLGELLCEAGKARGVSKEHGALAHGSKGHLVGMLTARQLQEVIVKAARHKRGIRLYTLRHTQRAADLKRCRAKAVGIIGELAVCGGWEGSHSGCLCDFLSFLLWLG